MLYTLGNNVLGGSHDLAMVGGPGNRAWRWIPFTAIVTTLLVQGPGCDLRGQCRDENRDSVIRRSQPGHRRGKVVRTYIVHLFQRTLHLQYGTDAWPKLVEK